MTVRKVAQRIPFTPSKTQAALLEQCFGARRFAYNQQVEAFNAYDKETNPRPKYPNVTDMKNENEWLRDSPIPSNALSNAIQDFRKTRAAYFRKAEYGKNRPRLRPRATLFSRFVTAHRCATWRENVIRCLGSWGRCAYVGETVSVTRWNRCLVGR